MDRHQHVTIKISEVLGYSEIPESEYYKLFGDGTFGCIDTTGLSQLITIEKSEYKNYNGDHTYMLGDRRYRYTNVAQTDSVEVAHVLHFRDSSLQGYDTLIVGTDTTAGVWKHEYTYQEMVNGVSIRRAANGPMTPTLSLTNTTSCTSNSATYLNVGFLNEYTVQEKEICEGLPIILDYYQRYYQYGEEDRNTYPINDFALWQDFARYSNNIETYETDWDSTDGVWDAERNIIPNHQYSDPGDYTISVVTKDSNNCRDTVYLNVSISKLEPHFGYDVTNVNCASIYNFIDSTEVYGDDDEILAWEWDFGDGTRRSILQNPSHQYTSGGYFDVKLKTWTALGCRDSITRRLYIPGPQPEFEFDIGIWPLDTLSICVGDTIRLKNISGGDLNTPKFLMDWGDGTFTTPPGIGSFYKHQYTKAGTYELFLTQEDEIPGTGNRCSRIFPDTNLDLLHQHRMVVLVKEKPDVRIGGRIAPTYQRHPTSFLADVDRRYTRYHWYIQGDTILKFAPDSQLIYKFQDVGIFNVILAPQYDVLPRCWDRDTIQMEVLARHLNPVQERKFEISVYPNPSNEEVFVTLPEGLKLLDITAIDMAGKEIQVRYTFESGNQIQVNTSDLASGNYQFKIETDTGVIHKKIVILQE